jgi:protein-tyrosine phosphatase
VQNYFPGEFVYLNLNVKDWGKDEGISRVFQLAREFVEGVKRAQQRVLVHCLAGVNRSVTVTIALLMVRRPLPAGL